MTTKSYYRLARTRVRSVSSMLDSGRYDGGWAGLGAKTFEMAARRSPRRSGLVTYAVIWVSAV